MDEVRRIPRRLGTIRRLGSDPGAANRTLCNATAKTVGNTPQTTPTLRVKATRASDATLRTLSGMAGMQAQALASRLLKGTIKNRKQADGGMITTCRQRSRI